ncbi:MAG: hypothetical protein ACE5HT_05640 [Gemmatimonadales bacterium]
MSADPSNDLVSRRMLVLAAVLSVIVLVGIALFFLFAGEVQPVLVTHATHTTPLTP